MREGLRSLPVPRNDFEIVVPEQGGGGEGEEAMEGGEAEFVEDAGDIDERIAQKKREEGTCYPVLYIYMSRE